MTYRIPLPDASRRSTLDVIDPFSSMVQRFLRREGLCNYEPETAAALLALFDSQAAPFTFYDVGANIGLYSHLCAAMFSDADVHAFEPTPEVAEICRAIARTNGLELQVVEVAVSDQSGPAELHLSDTSDASNSLVADFKESHGSIQVSQTTLDEYRRHTGSAPSVLKIDVETHEPAVLAGAIETITADRPSVVIEVLRRRGVDQGEVIQAAFDGLGYSYYPLSLDSDWTAKETIRGSGTIERDWLLTPSPIPVDFADRWNGWRTLLGECTPERNSRPPIAGAAQAAFRRGGVSELVSSARRLLSDDVVPNLRRRLDSRNRRGMKH